MFIAQSLSTLLETLVLFTAGLGLMFMTSWQLTFIACVLFPALGYAVVKFRRRIRLIQAYQRERTESERFHRLNRELFRRNMAAARERAVYLPLIFWLGSATGGIILWLGGSQVISGRITWGNSLP